MLFLRLMLQIGTVAAIALLITWEPRYSSCRHGDLIDTPYSNVLDVSLSSFSPLQSFLPFWSTQFLRSLIVAPVIQLILSSHPPLSLSLSLSLPPSPSSFILLTGVGGCLLSSALSKVPVRVLLAAREQ